MYSTACMCKKGAAETESQPDPAPPPNQRQHLPIERVFYVGISRTHCERFPNLKGPKATTYLTRVRLRHDVFYTKNQRSHGLSVAYCFATALLLCNSVASLSSGWNTSTYSVASSLTNLLIIACGCAFAGIINRRHPLFGRK